MLVDLNDKEVKTLGTNRYLRARWKPYAVITAIGVIGAFIWTGVLPEEATGVSGYLPLIPMLVGFGFFYLLLFRADKAGKALLSELKGKEEEG